MLEFKGKLYIVFNNSNSEEIIKRVEDLFELARKENDFELGMKLDIIDILAKPELAINDLVLASPTLVLETPPDTKRFVGVMPSTEKFLNYINNTKNQKCGL